MRFLPLVVSPLALTLAFAGATGSLDAQSAPNLIGPTLNSPLIHQSSHGTCTPIGNCGIGLLPTTTFFWAGGSAWDSANSALWVTNGQLLERYGMNGCTPQCGPQPCPKSSATAEATGMDLHDGNNELWIIDSAGWITQCTNSCTPTVIASYNTGLALAGNVATSAIAIDELRGLVFYATCDFGTGAGWIHTALLTSPGAWFQSTPVFECFSNPTLLTGLACDAANSTLYWTNGRGTFDWTYTYNPGGPSVTYVPGTCCIQVAPFTDPFTDLSIRWGGATSVGAPCANGSCPPCPMLHTLRNAPLLGSTLQLGLDQAEPSTLAVCAVDFGSCAPSGPVIPPFCGPVLVPFTAAMLLLGPQVPIGPTSCNGSTTFLLPLPANPLFAGTPLCSQCVALCVNTTGTGGGTMMSNCLSWVLQ